MLKEFKKFAMKGNVVDMAVGIIIGGAFTTIVKSFVADIIMPPIGLLLGGVDFNDMFIVLRAGVENPGPYVALADAQAAGAVTVNYGVFITNTISFLIVAFSVFWLVKGMNSLRAKEEPAQVTTKSCGYCYSTIPLKATRCPNCTSELPAESS
ncbi:large-conductance mechanosensitive channel protein MscL [Pseudidiomarina insulisalsae]|uniref:Large-conductance mechanosensitive channel n=1 Tax=Pseudidiomarina insulisalsae TaxID=575789 RepID=A0A432YQK1_9GAMM|nr:large-conductance mechanosensitive channel protein MscL [Pseudidiomarina insulisalsae]RUO63627.1 large conductance mechanosensitive channel protein MscL [Pseudidiomarina insulisalsae]